MSGTTIHPKTGAILRRRKRTETITYQGQSRTVEVEGWFPDGDGDGILVGADSKPLDDALAEMKCGWPGKPGVPKDAEQINLVARLRNTPNWLREEYGHYKDGLKVFDRAPFEAADALEFQSANIVSLRAENARLRKLVAYLAGTNTDHVQVALAGNPIVCNAIHAEACDALGETQ
jgi:hypothetical protein